MFLWKLLRHKFLVVLWVFVATLPGLGLTWAKEHKPEFIPSWLMGVLTFVYLFYLAGSFYVCIGTAAHIDADPAISFWLALRRSYVDLKMMLRFVPIIGPLFEPDEDKRHYDQEDE